MDDSDNLWHTAQNPTIRYRLDDFVLESLVMLVDLRAQTAPKRSFMQGLGIFC